MDALIKKQDSDKKINADELLYILGDKYYYGIDVEINEHEAFIYYQKAADMGSSDGTVTVGYCYENGIGVEKDEQKAFIYYQKSADMGHVDGTYNVCYFYKNGIGVEINKHEAFVYCQKAADMGHFDGTYDVGYCYKNGIGIEKDEHKAFIYYQKSADMGHDIGTFMVGRCYDNGVGVEKDEHKAFIYYQKSADMGNANGIFALGGCYYNGIGVEMDEQKAFIYYQKSADMGNASGTVNVGNCYENGIGVEKDEHKAFVYYQKCADMGNARGIVNVGFSYEKGIGVEKDEHKAFICYQKSADMGDTIGMNNLGNCYRYGIGVEKNEYKAFEFYKKVANMNVISGIGNLGDCYRNGLGVRRDIQRANYWYRKERSLKKTNKPSCEDIDNSLKKILNDEKYKLSWINYDEFKSIREIGKGGFATVFYAYCYDKNNNINTSVALKLIHDSNENVKNFVQELKYYCDIGYENPSFLGCYGISRDDTTKNYIIVLKHASKGSLRQNLELMSQFKWKDKLNIVYCIASDLESIHSQELVHRDLHSGNILQDNLYSAYITDLGLSSENEYEGKIYGILPYVAPEVLMGKLFTQAADIYSLGIIMAEISTGKRAFDGETFDFQLGIKICNEKNPLRPEFAPGTPDCYIKLAKRCMDKDPSKRPYVTVISGKITHWLDEIEQDDNNEIKKQFLEADKIKLKLIEPKHPNQMYTSKLIDVNKITEGLSKLMIPDNLI